MLQSQGAGRVRRSEERVVQKKERQQQTYPKARLVDTATAARLEDALHLRSSHDSKNASLGQVDPLKQMWRCLLVDPFSERDAIRAPRRGRLTRSSTFQSSPTACQEKLSRL